MMKSIDLQTKRRTIRITLNETAEDQALYDALIRTGEKEYRTPITRQAKHLLRMALGLREVDFWMLNRIGLTDVDHDDLVAEAVAAVAKKKAKTDLRLVKGALTERSVPNVKE